MSGCHLENAINETSEYEPGALWNSSFTRQSGRLDLIFAFVGFFIGGTSFGLNTLVFITLLFCKELRQNTHHNLVLCLSASDLVLGLSMCSFGFRIFTSQWGNYYLNCVIASVSFVSGVMLSYFQTFLISIHRFLKISNTELDQVLFQNKRKYAIYLFMWLGVFGFNISMVHLRHYSEEIPLCSFKCVFGSQYPIMIKYFQTITIILLSLIVAFYILTLCQIRKRYRKTFAWHAHQNTGNQSDTVTTAHTTNEQMALNIRGKIFGSIKLIGILICALLFCTCPMVIASFFDTTQKPVFILANLTCLNSIINPFIYVFSIEKLRLKWKKIWHIFKVF